MLATTKSLLVGCDVGSEVGEEVGDAVLKVMYTVVTCCIALLPLAAPFVCNRLSNAPALTESFNAVMQADIASSASLNM